MSLTSDVVSSLATAQIIPDVLPESLKETFTPTVILTIIYPTRVQTDLGNTVIRSNVLEEPDITITSLNPIPDVGNEKDMRYTLVMTDPDAPSRTEPKYRQWRHWVITGLQIPSPPPTSAQVAYALKPKPSTTPYWPPGPPPGSGLHRYTFLLFEEPEGGVTVPQGAVEYGTKLEERRSWDAIKFADQYGLRLVGANYFLCGE